MLSHDEITAKVDLIQKASAQITAMLVGSNRLIGQPSRLQQAMTDIRRKSDLISATIGEIIKDRADRAAARAAAVEPVAETPVPATPETDKAIADVHATNAAVAGGPAALMAGEPETKK